MAAGGATPGNLRGEMNGLPAKKRFRLDMDLGDSDSDSSSEGGVELRGGVNGGSGSERCSNSSHRNTPGIQHNKPSLVDLGGSSASDFRHVTEGVYGERSDGIVTGAGAQTGGSHETLARDGTGRQWQHESRLQEEDDASGGRSRREGEWNQQRDQGGDRVHSVGGNCFFSSSSSSQNISSSGGGGQKRRYYLDGDADCTRNGNNTTEDHRHRPEPQSQAHDGQRWSSQPYPIVTPEHTECAIDPPGAPGHQPANPRAQPFVARNPYKPATAAPRMTIPSAPRSRDTRDVRGQPLERGGASNGGAVGGAARAPTTVGNRNASVSSSSLGSRSSFGATAGDDGGTGRRASSSLKQVPLDTVAVRDVYRPELSR